MAQGITRNRKRLAIALGLWVLAATIPGVGSLAAQTPAAMTQERTEEVLQGYVAALTSNGAFADYFAGDIVVSFMDVGQEVVGKDAAEAAIVDFHTVAFDATLELRSFTAGPGLAYAEIVFSGPHTGDFAGIPATGREVRVPYVAVWELADDKITAIRLYGLTSVIIQQLTAPATPSS